MDLQEMLLVEDEPLLAEIHELLKRKMEGKEMVVENRLAYVPPLSTKSWLFFKIW
ncbi:nucleotidyltransferase domain-containing protein [Bacillus sp. FJAT-53060]|uniref:nucleotidyltransferase domain-containing protein n=1 Tax=Bacillus TaxID=1386 RepID=UPI0021F6646B|nr:nucleotidyltransferase domain-containing protein [Bacillus stratosphericus]